MSVCSGMRIGCPKAVWSFWVLCCKPLLLWFPWTISSVLSTQEISWALPTSCPLPSSYWPYTFLQDTLHVFPFRDHSPSWMVTLVLTITCFSFCPEAEGSVLLYLFEISLHVCIWVPTRMNKGLFSGLPLWLHIITQFLFSFSLTFCFLKNREWLLSLGF